MYDLFNEDDFINREEVASMELARILAEMNEVKAKLRKAKKKHKHGKKKGMKGKEFKKLGKKIKKLEERLEKLEERLEKLEMFLRTVAKQKQTKTWWHGVAEKSAPKVIDLISTIIECKSSSKKKDKD